MAFLYDKLKNNGVKVCANICGVSSYGSGTLYVTPNYYDYNYILTAKHIFQEDSQTPLSINKILNIEISYSELGEFKILEKIKKSDVENSIITFEQDLLIIIVKKNHELNFQQFLVSDDDHNDNEDFFSWATFAANPNELHNFELKRNDFERKRYKISGNLDYSLMYGISGGGVFHSNKSILCGIIYQFPNDKFQNETIDCVPIKFSEINFKLKSLKKVQLDTQSSRYKKEIQEEVVYIHQAFINDTCLDLELARKRLLTDIEDDWFHDPLKYIDLLNTEYLFEQFKDHFGTNNYKAQKAEKFYVPKKQFTLRQALISPLIDRIIYLAAVGVLAENLDKSMIPNVYSARYNNCSENQLIINGVEQWKKMKYKLDETANKKDSEGRYLYDCIIEIDLLNFYDNINKNLLYNKLIRVCETANEISAAKLIKEFLYNISSKDIGLPQNSDASALLASFYLNQIDILIVNVAPEYFRFMDDIRIFCRDKYEARRILQKFEFELNRCHLSVNSQKTKIYSFVDNNVPPDEENISRTHYTNSFDFDINKLYRLRKSDNYNYLNNAFHLSIKLLQENLMAEDINSSEESARKLNYALNTFEILGKKGINLYTQDSKFEKLILAATKNLIDKPWITSQVCKVLNLIPTESLNLEILENIEDIVINERYNMYSYQIYQLWLLLSKHKYNSPDLKNFAVKQIEKNDRTNEAVIAGMIIYICSVEEGFRRVILRKFEEGFTHGYFQNRVALVSLRSFNIDLIDKENINKTLQNAHPFTNKFKNKDLVYVQGFNEDRLDSDNYFDQLYSI